MVCLIAIFEHVHLLWRKNPVACTKVGVIIVGKIVIMTILLRSLSINLRILLPLPLALLTKLKNYLSRLLILCVLCMIIRAAPSWSLFWGSAPPATIPFITSLLQHCAAADSANCIVPLDFWYSHRRRHRAEIRDYVVVVESGPVLGGGL